MNKPRSHAEPDGAEGSIPSISFSVDPRKGAATARHAVSGACATTAEGGESRTATQPSTYVASTPARSGQRRNLVRFCGIRI